MFAYALEKGLQGLRRRGLQWAACGALLWPAAAAVGQGLPAELSKAWQATHLPESSLSLVVQEVDGPRLADVNGTVPRNPASVMKMVTTWSALSGLGPDYAWRTTFLAKDGGRPDAEGTLRGPLYLKAGGDPLLKIEDLWSLLRELRLRGIKNLSEVVVDRSMFGQVATDPGEFDGAADRPYNASPDALMVGLGAVRLVFQPDARAHKWIPIVDPPVPGVRISGDIKWSGATCPGSPAISTDVSNGGKEVIIHVGGTAAGSCGEFSVYRLVMSQPEYFSAVFQMLWKELGGTLGSGIHPGRVPPGATPVVWHDSASLADTIRLINKQSNNVMARTVLLTLGAEKLGPGATMDSGGKAALAVLQGQKVDTRGWVIDNGAGLARNARLTAAGLSQMLGVVWHSPMMSEFMSSLAIAGVDGTVKRRLRSDEVKGMAHLKTGTLRDSRALAGYVLGASGKRYIVVSLVNDERSGAVRSFDDALVTWLADR
ncbi:D-alanyl-D-alanine carboxypeptidase/D-alanyl-D-alanine-endopeptidase [Paralcaligenes sp. KSB-10]|uniref:D-alanyl-D-alanine carboxypeptidase/D-alanyl-D-alanine endopeptidase n=1 Tax=Paralcaligenes sp. KSB-10 TaxID=2901142 RepID=UPI001E38383A|nr:D-alanyl-D-alanine carboxypeptidase/D-alanyl-D-alanine-endopeptidase [Paralcaligenes sp. KSB-10]UHL62583.1 D-alanyl-D-alanine carboxypeptidase/D-alanyl-D-alanine-endopeptidase [Paralcaligenes sp. KSB-10]